MEEYKVSKGQNLFDVSLHLYGSAEGVIDLMLNNEHLSLSDSIPPGMVLNFSPDFSITPEVVHHFKTNGLVPANGERNVYFKEIQSQMVAEIFVDALQTSANFNLSGSGKMIIDWGDNTPIVPVVLSSQIQPVTHYFNNTVRVRKIRIYGEFEINALNLDGLPATAIYLHCPLPIEKFTMHSGKLDIEFMNLLDGCYKMDLTGLATSSLLPLLSNKKLTELNLSDLKVKKDAIDLFLICLVQQYYGRRSCRVILTEYPSGKYCEPSRDENGNYILCSGMEAIWVLTHEESWNEDRSWEFIINETSYQYHSQHENDQRYL